MNFEIYCDESGLEALNRKDAHLFSAIGGIWLPASYRSLLKENMYAIKEKYKIHGELKWKKLSPSYINFYIIGFLISIIIVLDIKKTLIRVQRLRPL
ncbi:MAG: hypothetical protein B6D64_14180 [Bacteroidetes bacterium 4484_276]|nr:MAG: hypothetical protein B6D64_14180 [Bacteroidetes bacterium 4484_276]